jgi:hypothetical protein
MTLINYGSEKTSKLMPNFKLYQHKILENSSLQVEVYTEAFSAEKQVCNLITLR